MSKADLFNAAKSRDLEWAVWKKGERIHSIPAKTRIEREAEENAAPAPRPEDYTFCGH